MRNKNKIYIFIACICLALIALSVEVYLIYRKNHVLPDNSQASSPVPAPITPTFQQTLEQAKNSIPAIETSQKIMADKFDQTLAFLVPSDAVTPSYSSSIYTDKTTGYLVSYEQNKNLIDLSQFFVDSFKKNNFTIGIGIRSGTTASIVATGSNYRAEADINFITSGQSKVTLKIQKISQ